ncbi:hypothetical protein EKN56_19760 [Limnobaculum zhutongyuii]|uniref:Uncharacterized protein n=1 Tax=Limnobaculum zhutongyuii TaxID=2498113 RepID=A0A411WQL6_9GAMM|nr:hypothetical protein EKN56_19760 [Limnobaculum zhutongyuii]TQS89672.1 hypothetical protein ELQ32_04480 [Limnobaculum zhutongyuii]
MKYFVHTEADDRGHHTVHVETCVHLPGKLRCHDLGEFSNCKAAVTEAKRLGYSRVNGCYYCCNSCHATS